jgi:hypothetical protein
MYRHIVCSVRWHAIHGKSPQSCTACTRQQGAARVVTKALKLASALNRQYCGQWFTHMWCFIPLPLSIIVMPMYCEQGYLSPPATCSAATRLDSSTAGSAASSSPVAAPSQHLLQQLPCSSIPF